MKRLIILGCLSVPLLSCRDSAQQNSDTKMYGSNLSDQSGKLPKTFLYLSEGSRIIQRECQSTSPKSVSDCAVLRSSRSESDFRVAVEQDIDLSLKRLTSALETLKGDRAQVQTRKADREREIQDLKSQLARLPPPSRGGASADPFTAQALAFAKQQRDMVKQQIANSSDPKFVLQLQEALKGFDIKIAELEAKVSGGGDPNSVLRADLQKRIRSAESLLSEANVDLVGLAAKIKAAETSESVAKEEKKIKDQVLAKLKQSIIFDATEASNALPQAEKQLVSRFHKLFTAGTPDCTEPKIDVMKELAIGQAPVYASSEAHVGGSFSFGEVLKPLLGGNPNPKQVEDFMRAWVTQWTVEFRTASGDLAAPRPQFMNVIDQWKNASAARGIDGLDLRLAPFRLMGITNRFDLRNPLVPGDAGEARMVYAMTDTPSDRPQDEGTNVKPFSLIFEYKVSALNDNEVPRWLNLWHELGSLPCTQADCRQYVQKLASITRMFTKKEGNIIRSSLGQLRTNEIAFGNPWELREFNVTNAGANSRLVQVDTKRTPQQSVNDSNQLAQFVNGISLQNLIQNNYEIPTGMRSAKAQVLGSNPEWKVAVDSEKARVFNLNTCNGCHSGDEKVIDGFYHISPFQKLGSDSMSAFMKNTDLPRRANVMKPFLRKAECLAGTPFDARLANEAGRMLSRPVH